MHIYGLVREVTQGERREEGKVTGLKFSAVVEVQEPLEIITVSLGDNASQIDSARSLVGKSALIPVRTSAFQGRVYLQATGQMRPVAAAAAKTA